MNRVLILVTGLFLVLMMVSCGGEDSSETCTGSDKFCHSHDGLDWSDDLSNDLNNLMTWDEAVTSCENLGGRLPTISELRTLIQKCPATETGGWCGVTDNCLSSDCWLDSCGMYESDYAGYSVFGDIYHLWSSSELSDDADNVWSVLFSNGGVYGENKSSSSGVRCVR